MNRQQNHINNEKIYQDSPEPLTRRLGRFVTLMGIIFTISGGVVVTQRLSEDALALLLGLSCGIAATMPTLLLGGLWLKRELGHEQDKLQKTTQPTAQPPVIVVTPQAVPGYRQAGQAALAPPLPSQWQSVPVEREFKIVGGVD